MLDTSNHGRFAHHSRSAEVHPREGAAALRATVIIPTYNCCASLARTLASLTALKSRSLAEVIVCDDGSTDATRTIAAGFARELPLKYRRQEDYGFRAASARNLGIRESTGDVIFFLDSDVIMPPGFLDAHLEKHSRTTGNSLVFGFRRRVTKAPSPGTELLAVHEYDADHREIVLGISEGVAAEIRPLWYFAYSCNMSVCGEARRALFDEEFVGWGNEDIEYAYRLALGGAELICAPEATLWHVDPVVCRDPFRQCPTVADFTPFVTNTVRMLLKYPDDAVLQNLLRADLSGYRNERDRCVRDPSCSEAQRLFEWATERILTSRSDAAGVGYNERR